MTDTSEECTGEEDFQRFQGRIELPLPSEFQRNPRTTCRRCPGYKTLQGTMVTMEGEFGSILKSTPRLQNFTQHVVRVECTNLTKTKSSFKSFRISRNYFCLHNTIILIVPRYHLIFGLILSAYNI